MLKYGKFLVAAVAAAMAVPVFAQTPDAAGVLTEVMQAVTAGLTFMAIAFLDKVKPTLPNWFWALFGPGLMFGLTWLSSWLPTVAVGEWWQPIVMGALVDWVHWLMTVNAPTVKAHMPR